MTIEHNFPIIEIQKLAKIESRRRQFYRPIYSLHKWWARRPGVTFRGIALSHFLAPEKIFTTDIPKVVPYYLKHNMQKKVVLDPFMGGGTTVVEMNRLGIRTIGIDLNPVAWWTVKKEVEFFDEDKFMEAFNQIKANTREKIKSFYKTKCTNPKCESDNADIMYCFWVKTISCPSCSRDVELFKYYIIGKKQRGDPYTKVLCPKCKKLFYTNKPVSKENVCPDSSCKTKFIPNLGNARKKIVHCQDCDQTFKLTEALQRQSKPLEGKIIALEYYCDTCKTRDYKNPDQEDIDLYQKAVDEFKNLEKDLLYPKEELPSLGQTTNNLHNYNYKQFSDLFNKRQLLCLALLLGEISKITDFSTMEYLLAAFSSGLEFHTVLCPYNYTMKQIVNVFNVQGFLIPTMHVENNVWGTKKGNGTFITYINRVLKAKKYCENPFEVLVDSKDKKKFYIKNEKILAKNVRSFDELLSLTENNVFLVCGTSEDLEISPLNIPSKSIDAVITDPPYFSTIQYSELADFFFVWLKLLLANKYEYFNQSHSPKFNEVVMNNTRNKDEESFLQGLTRVFSECNRVLKDNGPLIFTFHHKESLAWASVLGAIFNSGFYITAVFPVVSEFQARTVKSINYDAIIVCRKRKRNESIIWEDLEDRLYDQLDILAHEIRINYNLLSKGDQMIILFGRCLEIVSIYSNVLENEVEITVNDLISRVLKIVDEKTVEEFLPDLDLITRIYLTILIDQKIWSLDELNKRTRHQQIELEVLLNQNFIEKKESLYYIVDIKDRYDYLARNYEKGKMLTLIDKIHFLYYQFKHSADYQKYTEVWRGNEPLINICEYLAKKKNDGVYSKIKKSLLKQRAIQKTLDL